MFEREKRVLARHYLDEGVRKAEVARRVGIGRRTLYNWIADGLLESRLGDRKNGYGPRRPRASKLDPFKAPPGHQGEVDFAEFRLPHGAGGTR